MKKNRYHIIGTMSGTSLDGIDLAEIVFHLVDGKWIFEIIAAETVPYSSYWTEMLSGAMHFSRENIERLDFKYTQKLSDEISRFISKHNILEIDAICNHGHTVFHRPEKKFTYQIGNLPRIAKLLGHTVVCDFRIQDVELGGQGAPLVPIGDRLLFSDYDYCLNLGGFANCSFEKNDKRIAYDVCPVNIVLNQYAKNLGKDFDNGGNFARKGSVNQDLLQKLEVLPYYDKKPPKSLGLEWVNNNIFPLLGSFNIASEDILRTFTVHIASQLARQFPKNASVLVTGGGAYNSFLLESFQNLSGVSVAVPSSKLIDYKEALIFGLLGVLRLRNEINCLSSVTGSQFDHSSGKVFTP